jgi:hypothetical protein
MFDCTATEVTGTSGVTTGGENRWWPSRVDLTERIVY